MEPPAVPGIFTGPLATFDGTGSQAHQLAMSLMVTVYPCIYYQNY